MGRVNDIGSEFPGDAADVLPVDPSVSQSQVDYPTRLSKTTVRTNRVSTLDIPTDGVNFLCITDEMVPAYAALEIIGLVPGAETIDGTESYQVQRPSADSLDSSLIFFNGPEVVQNGEIGLAYWSPAICLVPLFQLNSGQEVHETWFTGTTVGTVENEFGLSSAQIGFTALQQLNIQNAVVKATPGNALFIPYAILELHDDNAVYTCVKVDLSNPSFTPNANSPTIDVVHEQEWAQGLTGHRLTFGQKLFVSRLTAVVSIGNNTYEFNNTIINCK